MAAKYTLELFPITDKYANMYTTLFMGCCEVIPDGENAGIDLICVEQQTVNPGGTATLLKLGVKARMIRHWEEYCTDTQTFVKKEAFCNYWLAPRSSIWKSNIRQANSIGVIDKSYRGELMGAVLTNTNDSSIIKPTTRLFQIVAPDMGHISRVIIRCITDIDSTIRGEGCFGSTGR
jgi:dUTPase